MLEFRNHCQLQWPKREAQEIGLSLFTIIFLFCSFVKLLRSSTNKNSPEQQNRSQALARQSGPASWLRLAALYPELHDKRGRTNLLRPKPCHRNYLLVCSAQPTVRPVPQYSPPSGDLRLWRHGDLSALYLHHQKRNFILNLWYCVRRCCNEPYVNQRDKPNRTSLRFVGIISDDVQVLCHGSNYTCCNISTLLGFKWTPEFGP